MTIPSSGPLALTAIQTEFGGANPISLNEYYAGGAYVPAGTSGTYGAVPSSGAIGIQVFYGTSNGPPYWIIASIISANIDENIACNAAVDSAGNVYLVGMPDTGEYPFRYKNSNGFYIIKTQQTALSIASSTIVSDGYVYADGARVAIDSSNNVYVAYNGPVTVDSVATYGIGLVKYNSSGTLQWSKTIGSSTIPTPPFAPVGGVAIDSAGYIYVSGLLVSLADTQRCIVVAKYDSAGALQWGRKITSPTGYEIIETGFNSTLSIDSANNVYVGARFERDSNSVDNPLAIVLDSSGTLISGKTIYGNGNDNAFQNFGGVTFDSAGYVWFLSSVTNDASFTNKALMLKKLSNANPPVRQFTRGVISTTANQSWIARGVARDISDNIYVVGFLFNTSTNLTIGNIIIKYNSAGTVQWQRQFSKSGTGVDINNIIIDSASTFIISGASDDKYALSVRLPTDGSRTGTYGVYTYAASTYTTGSFYSDVGLNSPVPVSVTFPSTIQSVTTTVTPDTSLAFTTTITAA